MGETVKVVAIVQARMGSSRLPGKVLADIAGTPMLIRIIERVSAAESVDEVVVATTTDRDDDALVEKLEAGGTAVYRGERDDVLERFYGCAAAHKADIVVRVTADDPLKDPGIVDQAVGIMLDDPALDYCSNTIEPTYPEGLDIEVVRFSALERARAEATVQSDREHVIPYIWRHPALFKTHNFRMNRDLSDWRWTVDKQADLEFARAVYTRFKNQPLVGYEEVIAWLDANPQTRMINAGTPRNEGYLNSIRSDDS